MSNHITKLTEEYLDKYCQEKKYAVKKTPMENFKRIEVSNLIETIPLSLYDTGKLVVGGSPKFKLKSEFDALKQKITDSPEILGGVQVQKIKAGRRYPTTFRSFTGTRVSVSSGLRPFPGEVSRRVFFSAFGTGTG
jgi:hypothetical protein